MLEGKLVNLPKPLAVMNRVPSESAIGDGMALDSETDSTSPTVPPRWDIVAVVKRKMVFAKRPMPMVGKVSTTVDSDPGKDGK